MDSNILGFYINLKQDYKRKKILKKQLDKYKLNFFKRKEPIGVEYIGKTSISLPESSLFLTNLEILNDNKNRNKHLLIVEDDIQFNKNISFILNQLEDVFDTDIIFLEASLFMADVLKTKEYFKLLESFYKTQNYTFLDAKNYYLSGAIAVLYNKNSIDKIVRLLEQYKLQYPYDITLRNFISSDMLSAKIMFPFPVGLNNNVALQSNIKSYQKGSFLYYSLKFREQMYIKDILTQKL